MSSRLRTYIGVFHASRRVFENYLVVLLEYFVYRRLFPQRTIGVKCRSGGMRSLTPSEVHKLLLGLRIGSIVRYCCKNNTVVLCNNTKAPLPEILKIDLEAPPYDWRYNSKGFWELNGVKMKHVTATVIEVFNKRYYDRLKHVEGRTVVDVGAGVGDSTVYFALRGARRVIALEPIKEYYRELLENIKLNNVEDRVIALNEWAGADTLAVLTNRYGIADEGVLKIDCEGCEYTVLTETPINILKRFKEILIEYHGSPKPLARKLIEAGFKVTVEPPWTTMNNQPVGFIHAEAKR
jgi:hypothetical protein